MLSHPSVSFLGVNDGSRDKTEALLNALHVEFGHQFKALNLAKNSGKAEAVRQGMLFALKENEFDYVGYWDADFSTPLDEIDHFMAFCGGTLSHSIVMGSRIARLGSQVQRKMMRHYLGRIFSTLTSRILKLRVYDTQCGAKLIAANEIENLFKIPFVSKWFFDVELLARFIVKHGREQTYKQVMEVPLTKWIEVGGSKLKAFDFLKVPLELFKIRRHYKLG
jgi:glycosyltransferase involved in cell wall biosynthesis